MQSVVLWPLYPVMHMYPHVFYLHMCRRSGVITGFEFSAQRFQNYKNMKKWPSSTSSNLYGHLPTSKFSQTWRHQLLSNRIIIPWMATFPPFGTFILTTQKYSCSRSLLRLHLFIAYQRLQCHLHPQLFALLQYYYLVLFVASSAFVFKSPRDRWHHHTNILESILRPHSCCVK